MDFSRNMHFNVQPGGGQGNNGQPNQQQQPGGVPGGISGQGVPGPQPWHSEVTSDDRKRLIFVLYV
jgi:hypothetical protein